MRLHTTEEQHTKRTRKCGTVWSDIQSVELIGICKREQMEREEQHSILETLMRQMPDIFTWFDAPQKPGAFAHADVPAGQLGSFKTSSLWEDILKQREHAPAIEGSGLDKE
jgi:hypothetical protein